MCDAMNKPQVYPSISLQSLGFITHPLAYIVKHEPNFHVILILKVYENMNFIHFGDLFWNNLHIIDP